MIEYLVLVGYRYLFKLTNCTNPLVFLNENAYNTLATINTISTVQRFLFATESNRLDHMDTTNNQTTHRYNR